MLDMEDETIERKKMLCEKRSYTAAAVVSQQIHEQEKYEESKPKPQLNYDNDMLNIISMPNSHGQVNVLDSGNQPAEDAGGVSSEESPMPRTEQPL